MVKMTKKMWRRKMKRKMIIIVETAETDGAPGIMIAGTGDTMADMIDTDIMTHTGHQDLVMGTGAEEVQ